MYKGKSQKGFTLLVAIVTTSMLIVVSFVVANVALKQVIIASSSQQSQFSFYNADSGTECAIYWDLNGTTSPFDPYIPAANVTCNGQSLPQVRTFLFPYTYSTSTITFDLPRGCVRVDIVKKTGLATTTKIDSHGFNTCASGVVRKFERGITITY